LEERVFSLENHTEDSLLLDQEMMPEIPNKAGLRFISGIICTSKALTFERMLFRATRGNMFFNKSPADEQVLDPVSGEMVCCLLFSLLHQMFLPFYVI